MTASETSMNSGGCKPWLSFSIERILYGHFKKEENRRDRKPRVAGHAPEETRKALPTLQGEVGGHTFQKFAWLHFTRYNPPKLPKSSKRRIKKKRNPGRNPRVPFTPKQLTTLEGKFQKMKYLANDDVAVLCKDLSLPEHRIKIWFQNRRAREKKKSQDEYVDVTSLEPN